MGQVAEKAEGEPLEWIGWDTALRLLKTAGVGLMPYKTLAEWCAGGHIDSEAAIVTRGSEVERDCELTAGLWEMTSEVGVFLDPLDGSVRTSYTPDGAEKPLPFAVIRPRFRKDQVLAMVSHLTSEEIQAALVAGGSWIGGPAGERSPPPSPQMSNRGGQRLHEGWPEFVAELCAHIHEHGIPEGVGTQGAEALIGAVLDGLMKRGVDHAPSRSTVQKAVNQTLLRLRQA